MTRFRVAPSTVLALVAILGVGVCDPCDPCDSSTQVNAATLSADALPGTERSALSVD